MEGEGVREGGEVGQVIVIKTACTSQVSDRVGGKGSGHLTEIGML